MIVKIVKKKLPQQMFLFPISLITYKNDLKTKPGFDNFQKQSPRAVLLKRKRCS